jgi:hypothetical protein
MKQKYYTAAERAEVWERWKRGEGLIEIGRALGRQRWLGNSAHGVRWNFRLRSA